MGNLFLPIMRMNVHLNQDGSIGKEREENDANHGETPNLQGRQSWNKKELLRFFWKQNMRLETIPPLAFGVSLITPLKIPIWEAFLINSSQWGKLHDHHNCHDHDDIDLAEEDSDKKGSSCRISRWWEEERKPWFLSSIVMIVMIVMIIIIVTKAMSITNHNNTITYGGSTAPLNCWYHTEERTIQEHKRDWKDVRGIVGRR